MVVKTTMYFQKLNGASAGFLPPTSKALPLLLLVFHGKAHLSHVTWFASNHNRILCNAYMYTNSILCKKLLCHKTLLFRQMWKCEEFVILYDISTTYNLFSWESFDTFDAFWKLMNQKIICDSLFCIQSGLLSLKMIIAKCCALTII